MCLSTVYSKKKRLELIEKHQKGEFIWVWKTFYVHWGRYVATFFKFRFYSGKNKANCENTGEGYKSGIHSFPNKEDAYVWRTEKREIVKKCRVPVKSITAMGVQWLGGKDLLVIVSTEIICPKYFGSRK